MNKHPIALNAKAIHAHMMSRLPPHEQALLSSHMAAHQAQEEKALLEKIPEWANDPQRAQAEMAGLRAGAVQKYGIHPALVEDFPHHEGVLMLRDALMGRAWKAELDKMKAAEAGRKKEQTASNADQKRHEDFKRRLEDVKRSPGGKQSRAEMIADYVDGEDGR